MYRGRVSRKSEPQTVHPDKEWFSSSVEAHLFPNASASDVASLTGLNFDREHVTFAADGFDNGRFLGVVA